VRHSSDRRFAVPGPRPQHQCPLDLADHLAMPYDSATIQDVLNALGPDNRALRPNCALSLPLLGAP